jgi:hypothetical protein
MKKWYTLHKEEIGAQRYVVVMLQDWGRNRFGHKRWRSWGGARPRSFTFYGSDVWTVNNEGALGVVWRHWAISNQVVP